MTEGRPLLLLDAASLWFRMFHAVPRTVTAPDGTPVNAVRGFVDGVARVIDLVRPGRFVACLDHDWRPAFRVALVPSYKAQRLTPDGRAEEVPPELPHQVPIILDVLERVGLAALGADGFEADDVIGTLAAADAGPVVVVTGDRDLFQVVDDERSVVVLYTGRGMGKLQVVDDAWLVRSYGVPAARYADMAVLRGDASDGLPGVSGIGERTAASIIQRYGTVEALLAALDDGAPDVPKRAALLQARQYLQAATGVVRVRTDVPLPSVDTTLPAAPVDPDGLAGVAERWGLQAPVERLRQSLAAAHEG